MIYGQFSVAGRRFNMDNLWNDPRGLTGSEVSFFSLSRELAKTHSISIFTIHSTKEPIVWEGCKVFDIDELPHRRHIHRTQAEAARSNFDAFCSWNEPDYLRNVSPDSVRLVNQQLNDFGYCASDFDDFVDVYTSPSDAHMDYIRRYTKSPDKWTVLANGCDISQYPNVPKVPGRVIYASSPDRGLHLLLQAWPNIKRAVPHAHLKIFYNFEPWFQRMKNESFNPDPLYRELCYRALYIREALNRLKNHGVEHFHSVSRTQMAKEMAEAEVLAYPCDTIRYTEGFSVTLMEACASGALPVTSSVDSLGSIYGGVVPMVKAPVSENMDEFTDKVVKGLTDHSWRKVNSDRAKRFSSNFEWPILAKKLDRIIEVNRAMKLTDLKP